MQAALFPAIDAADPARPTEAPLVRLRPRFELRCAACGYGVVVRLAPANCPMCRGTTWEHPPRLHRLGLQSV